MTEQCRCKGGWATYYSGDRKELIAMGFPENMFPQSTRRKHLRINGRDAYIQRKDAAYELTLYWDHNGPWYFSAEHPALSELARMTIIDFNYWIEPFGMGGRDKEEPNEVPTHKLIACEAAVDYRLPANKRFKFSNGLKQQISNLADQIYYAIRTAEIMPIEPATANIDKPQNDRDGNVIYLRSQKEVEAAE